MKPTKFKSLLGAKHSILKQDQDLRGKRPSYLLSLFAYQAFFTFVLVAAAIVLLIALWYMLPTKLANRVMDWVLIASFLSYVLLVPRLSHRAARLRVELDLGFRQGLRHALEEIRSMCCSLPLIGPLITPDSYFTKDNGDPADDRDSTQ